MTKKDYIKIAELLKNNRKAIKEAEREKRKITIEGIIIAIERDIADLLFEDNPKFSRLKFREYIEKV